MKTRKEILLRDALYTKEQGYRFIVSYTTTFTPEHDEMAGEEFKTLEEAEERYNAIISSRQYKDCDYYDVVISAIIKRSDY